MRLTQSPAVAYAYLTTEKKVVRVRSLSKVAMSRKVSRNAAFSCLTSSMDGLRREPQGSLVRFPSLLTSSAPSTCLEAGVRFLNLNESEHDMTTTTAVSPSVFSFEAHEIRSVTLDNEPWFVAADVCKVLDISNHRDAVIRLDADEKDDVGLTDAIGRTQNTTIISESGLYTLILRCRDAVKPGTLPHRFRKFTTSVMLPAIRKTGKYKSPKQTALPLETTEDLNKEMRNALAHMLVLIGRDKMDGIAVIFKEKGCKGQSFVGGSFAQDEEYGRHAVAKFLESLGGAITITPKRTQAKPVIELHNCNVTINN